MEEIDQDLKIISSVNTPPHLAIDSGSLRPDLFYPLAVVFIQKYFHIVFLFIFAFYRINFILFLNFIGLVLLKLICKIDG